MPRHPRHQSLSGGFTLLEAMVGLATFMIIAAVLVSLFAAAIKTYVFTLRQNAVLTNARKMFEGDGTAHGMLWNSRNGSALQSLSATSLNLTASDGTTVLFALVNGVLSRTQSSVTVPLGNTITAFTPTYYNLDALGRIMVSTSAASANFVTAYMQTQSTGKKTFSFYTGARLRNHS